MVQHNASEELLGFSEPDWSSDIDDRRSFSGYVFRLAGGAIAWSARKQRAPALSSMEAEYNAVTEMTSPAVWLHRLINEMGHPFAVIPLFCDNEAAIAFTSND